MRISYQFTLSLVAGCMLAATAGGAFAAGGIGDYFAGLGSVSDTHAYQFVSEPIPLDEPAPAEVSPSDVGLDFKPYKSEGDYYPAIEQTGCGTFDPSCGCPSPCCGDGCGCCNSCGCGGGFCDGCLDTLNGVPELLLGCFCKTSCRYDDWISPMTNPVFFEDPRTLTEVRTIFLQHKVPVAAGGGDVQLYAVQIRAALSDRLSLIATKDGYAVSSNALIDDGWADVALGLKYNLFEDCCTETLVSAGVVYEMPVGTPRTLQGNGDGEFHLFLTGGTEINCDCHWVSGFGLRMPVDQDAEETSIYWSNHLDYHLGHGFYVLTEFNWYHWTADGAGGIDGVSGGDLFNLGSTGVNNNDIVTGAFGVKYKPNRLTEIGVAWENPLTQRRDVMENRITVDLILRY